MDKKILTKRMTPQLEKKISFAIKLIQAASESMNGEPIEVAYSGGKDSDVILQLTKEAGVPYRAIYKCTTIDPPGTIRHAKEMGAEIVKPQMNFSEVIASNGCPFPTKRVCCSILKEYKILDKQIQGIRRYESTARAKRYKEPTACRLYSKTDRVEIIYPILEWTNEDVLEFIQDRQIQLHPLYYREDGTIDVKRRLGCIGCVMASDNNRIRQFIKYPKMVRYWTKAIRKFFDTHPDCTTRQKVNNNEYDEFCKNLFCRGDDVKFYLFKHTLFGETDCKAYLEDYFKIKL